MTITALPPVPLRTDAEAIFATKADTFMAALPQLVDELNAYVGDISGSASVTTLFATGGLIKLGYDTGHTDEVWLESNATYCAVRGRQAKPLKLFAYDTEIVDLTNTGLAVTGALSATGALTTNGLKEDASGNLGLLVTPSAWSNSNALQVGSLASISYNITTGASSLHNNSYQDTSTTYKYQYSGLASRYDQVSGNHTWYTAPSGTAGNTITFTQALSIDASGTVLVKQGAPTSKSAAATLTIAELQTSIIQYTGAVANLTLPTGTAIDAGFTSPVTDTAFDFYVLNTGSGIATIVTNTGLTLVGSMAVAVGGGGAMFRARRTAANTYTIYRIS